MSWADKYIGTPFLNKGRSKAGFDCYGLLREVYRNELGIDLPHLADDYGNCSDGETIEPIVDSQRDRWMKVEAPMELDVILINLKGFATHVGVVLSDHRFLHIMRGRNAVIDRYTNRIWSARIEGFYRCQ